jgi:hypothetical protein
VRPADSVARSFERPELEGDESGIGRKAIIAALKLFARDVLRGKQLKWEVISRSELDWTLARVARMVDRPAAGALKVDPRRVTGAPMVAYTDVATWMVEEVSARRYVHGAPFLSG